MKEQDPFEGRNGGVVLLGPEHRHTLSAFGGPLVGWLPANNADGLVQKRGGWGLVRIVHWKRGPDGAVQMLYDQPIIVEAAGVVVVPFYRGPEVSSGSVW